MSDLSESPLIKIWFLPKNLFYVNITFEYRDRLCMYIIRAKKCSALVIE